MPGSPVDDIIKGYIEEVRTYIPLLTKGINSLREDPGQKDIIEELHRLVHTVKGASMMVGIPGLSNIALQMENALADVLEEKLEFTQETGQTMAETVEQFQEYCTGLLGEGVHSQLMLKKTILAYRRLRGLPEEEDKAAAALLLEGVPEYEGGMDNGDDLDDTLELSDIIEPEQEVFPEEIEEPEIISLEPASSQMPDIIPELLESFYEEAKEHLEELDGALNILESQITARTEISESLKEIIRRIRRSVHTLKGASAVIGLSNISSWGHIMEDFLDWLYEDAKAIEPETVALLMDSGDLLTHIVYNPNDPYAEKCEALKNQYSGIIGKSSDTTEESDPLPAPASSEPDEPSSLVFEEVQADNFSRQTQTLRVGTEQVDKLVNLTGELMIASSAFDQQMNIFMDAINELEWARNRIREIARDMEVGYEVKALGDIKGMGLLMEGSESAAVETETEEKKFDDFDSLELDRYSELSMIIRTLNESAIDVGAIYSRLLGFHSDFDGQLNRHRVLLSELQDKMMQVRMLPMSTLSNKLRRTIREVSKFLGKKIRLIIEGEGIELDRMVWEKIADPLMHLLRNAADHGVEMPEVRREKKKPPVATIKLAAAREGNQVVIRISDDGAGLNYENIEKKARQSGFLNINETISEEELASLIFKPGLSTRDKISEVSGRGVGMDVVRENIHELKGTVKVVSRKDKGTQFIIRIPLTLAAVRALLFTVEDQIFAIALNEISEIIRVEPQNMISRPTRAIRTGSDILPIYSLRNFLYPGKEFDETTVSPIVLVIGPEGHRKALEIDTLSGQQEIVIKSTGSHLRYVKGISGVTIIGDGNVIPILNIPELIGVEQGISHKTEDKSEIFEQGITLEKPLSIMVVDDSVSIRQVVSRLIEEQGWQARTAKDGIDALEKLREWLPDMILLDIEMPRMNGYELLSALSAEPEYQNIPVVMLTSRATGKHRDRAIALGARGFVIKPYNDNEFIDLILRLTG